MAEEYKLDFTQHELSLIGYALQVVLTGDEAEVTDKEVDELNDILAKVNKTAGFEEMRLNIKKEEK